MSPALRVSRAPSVCVERLSLRKTTWPSANSAMTPPEWKEKSSLSVTQLMKHVPGHFPAAQKGYVGGVALEDLFTVMPSKVHPSTAPELPVSAQPQPSDVTIPAA